VAKATNPFRRGADPPAARAVPTLPRQITKPSRHLALDQHHDVVKRRIGLAVRIDTARVVWFVGRRVPTPATQVDAADECDAIVDDDQLLVV
jgi:hypothetical protein